jgi:hypothetical protein
VEVYFPPDKLGWHGMPVAYEGSCELMVAGDVSGLSAIGAFMLPPMADF